MKTTITDVVFCYTFSTLGIAAFSWGLDVALYSSYHGAGLMLAIAGSGMLGISGNESLKM